MVLPSAVRPASLLVRSTFPRLKSLENHPPDLTTPRPGSGVIPVFVGDDAGGFFSVWFAGEDEEHAAARRRGITVIPRMVRLVRASLIQFSTERSTHTSLNAKLDDRLTLRRRCCRPYPFPPLRRFQSFVSELHSFASDHPRFLTTSSRHTPVQT